MAKVKTKHLKILQGSTYVHTFAVTHEDGTAYDLTGFSARMQIRSAVDAATTLYEADSGDVSPDLVVNEADSEVTVTIPAATSAGWTVADFEDAAYDIEVVLGTFVKRIVKGDVVLDPEVTR